MRRLGDDLFVAGDAVAWQQATPGDAALVGRTVEAGGKVGGDAMLAGRNVEVAATIGQDLYAAGGAIRVTGTVGDSARLAGGEVTIAPAASIDGGASLAGGRVTIDGRIGRYASVAAGATRVNGRIDGDLTVAGGELALGPQAVVQGRLAYRGPQPAQIAAGAQVQGGIDQPRADASSGSSVWMLWWGAAWIVGWVAAGAVLLVAAPRVTRRVTDALRARPLASSLFGLLLLLGLPLLIVLLMVTVIGVPLGLLSIALYLVLVPIGTLASAAALGDWALARRGASARTSRRVLAMALALVVLFALALVPYVGWLVWMLSVLFGIGAIALAFARGRRDAALPA